jgi:alanyl-tRNA synthetase
MVQFKPYFLQQKQLEAPYVGTTTAQKCVRTTDIDVIGTDGRHLSFFEMLGNFAFGAYFKQEMCAWAYEFSTEVLGFDPERLYYTVYLDDDETVDIWKSLGVPESHITRLGEADNFWTAGPTGPCGPCSELYYDQGSEVGCGRADCAPGCDCDRFLEYWNLVFTQYDRQEDGTLLPLPKKNIDTGMGLERAATLLQGVTSNFESDILRGMIAVGERLSGVQYGTDEKTDLSLRIVADHARAVTFMIADGILPSNEGRGYVLRRLLRRAVRHGQLLGIDPPFLGSYVAAIVDEMGGPYPELLENRSLIERIVHAEEERFNQTLRQGQSYLDQELAGLKGGAVLSGKTAFELHDRYGFPVELTVEIASEQGIEVDHAGFERHMTAQRERARAHVKDEAWSTYGGVFSELLSEQGASRFVGYTQHEATTQVVALLVDGKRVQTVGEGQKAQVVLEQTPFYAEMGGQLGDTGSLLSEHDQGNSEFVVEDTKVFAGGVYAHLGFVRGNHAPGVLCVGDSVHASIDSQRRARIERNHTATHLLHHALQQVLGEHVKQAGSLVAPDRLRFDFTHFEAVSAQQLAEVEQLVNTLVMEDSSVTAHETSLDEARASGVTALFGEKYGERVRVLEAGPASRELCGGTHVTHTAQIGFLKITAETSVGANLRRIEAVTSLDALAYVNRIEAELRATATTLKASIFDVADKTVATLAHTRGLEDALKQSRKAAASDDLDALLGGALDAGYPLVVARIDGCDVQGIRDAWDGLRQKLLAGEAAGRGAAVVLGSITPAGSPLLLAAGTAEAVAAGFDAGALIKAISPAIKGGGGGKPALAQAGGKDAGGLDTALEQARAHFA